MPADSPANLPVPPSQLEPLQNLVATVDVATFSMHGTQLQVLLIQRSNQPCQGEWALPGGFLHTNEDSDLVDAAQRMLGGKTGLLEPYLEQVASVGSAKRDPRGWSLTVLYMALMTPDQVQQYASSNPQRSENCQWVNVDDALSNYALAFDHQTLLRQARQRLADKASYSSLAAMLMPKQFTLNELQAVYEVLTEQKLDPKSFRRRMLASDFLQETGDMQAGRTRSAKLYRLSDKQLTLFKRVTRGQRSK